MGPTVHSSLGSKVELYIYVYFRKLRQLKFKNHFKQRFLLKKDIEFFVPNEWPTRRFRLSQDFSISLQWSSFNLGRVTKFI